MLSLSVILTFLTLGALWLAAVLNEHDMHPMRRLAELMKRPALEVALVALVAVGLIHHGATKGTNGVNGVGGGLDGGTNGVQNVGGFLTGLTGLTGFWDGGGQGLPTLPTTNYQLSTTNLDWLAFGGYVDWFRVEDGAWCFRFGSNLVERVTVFSCGEIESAPFGASNRISLLGLPLSIVPAANWHLLNPQRSLFWHTATPSNTLLLTWENALVRRDTNLPVTVQVELFPDGAAALRYDFTTMCDVSVLSNAEARIVRDGLAEAVPLMTGAVTLVEFAAPTIAGTNLIDEVQARIAGGNTNAYYCADVVVAKGPSKIRVEPMADETNRGLLGAYEIVALPGETNRLPLLIGPKYTVSAEVAFESFELVPPPFVPLADDTGTVERLEFGEAFSATNVTDRLVEVQWPVEFVLEEIDATPEATTYALRVTPDWLDGEVAWYGIVDTNAPPMRGAPPMRSGGGCCGCLSVPEGSTNMITHSVSCVCTECIVSNGGGVSGEYTYEGYIERFGISFPSDTGGGSDPGPDDPTGPDPPTLELPSVSVAFDRDVVIFEDGYENSPGVFVSRCSTRTKLTVTASGGDTGGVLALSIDGGLQICPEQSGMPGYVAPNQTIEWDAYYEGVSASPSQSGAYATVTADSGIPGIDPSSDTANATVVEVKLRPKLLANNCQYRHIVGVCESVDCLHQPSSFSINWNSTGDGMIIEEDGATVFVANVTGNSAQLSVANGDTPYHSNLTIIEPSGLLCSNEITVVSNSVPQGATGGIGMKLHLYVLPLTVSFANIAVEEVPCLTGTHSGYFSNPIFSGRWSHTYAMGAGRWRNVNLGNYYGQDTSTSGDWPAPWSWGIMTWDIPIGWTYANPDEGDPQEKNFPVQYLSTWTLEADGSMSKSKHGHTVSRTTNDVIRLDGVIVNGN